MGGWPLPMHAIAMVTACGVSLVLRKPWPLVLGTGLSFAGIVAGAARRWTPSGRFGPANAITSIRLLLLICLTASADRLFSITVAIGFLLALLLDVLDGYVARRGGHGSAFGATFDMEVDAAFILFAGSLLWMRADHGLWVLVPGLLRYVYVLALIVIPPRGRDRARSRFGRAAFVITASCLVTAIAMGKTVAGILVAEIGALVSCVSFGHSFYDVYALSAKRDVHAIGKPAGRWRTFKSYVVFVSAWSFLNVVVNVRYPASDPPGWYFLPALDTSAILALFALLGVVGWRVHWALRMPLVAWLVFIRLMRFGDGVASQYFSRPFNFYTDLPMVSELLRFLHSTMAPWRFVAAVVATVGALGLVVYALDRALAFLATHLRRPQNAAIFATITLPFVLASQFLEHDTRYVQRYTGAFGSSSLPRMVSEANFLMNVYSHQAHEAKAIASVQETLHHTPTGLERLHHANVLLMFVESYGATVLEKPIFAAKALPALQSAGTDLADHGFSTASGLLTSATYGGMSWLAHATFMTGVRTTNQLEYDLLGVHKPRTMARVFHEAGYHTVLVSPNTSRKSTGADFYDFDQAFSSWNFDYAGPPFAWATMPDQYVLDFARRRVVEPAQGPLFAAYVLVSSHAPWSHVPTLVPDWSQVGNGAIYHAHPFKRAYLDWSNFSQASEPYLNSILYDFEVLRGYLTQFVNDKTLIIVLGDHQPVSEVTDNSQSWSVPIHVISRDPDLVAPFLSRGYAQGMVPGTVTLPMESFLVDFLRDFSGAAS